MDLRPIWEEQNDLPLAGGRRATGLFRVIYSGKGARWFLYGGAAAVLMVSLFTGWPGAGPYGVEPTEVVNRRNVEVEVAFQPVVKTVTVVKNVPVQAVAQVPYATETEVGPGTEVRPQFDAAPSTSTPRNARSVSAAPHEAAPVSREKIEAADPETAARASELETHSSANKNAGDNKVASHESAVPDYSGDTVLDRPASTPASPASKKSADAAKASGTSKSAAKAAKSSKTIGAKSKPAAPVAAAPMPASAQAWATSTTPSYPTAEMAGTATQSSDVEYISSEDPPSTDAYITSSPTTTKSQSATRATAATAKASSASKSTAASAKSSGGSKTTASATTGAKTAAAKAGATKVATSKTTSSSKSAASAPNPSAYIAASDPMMSTQNASAMNYAAPARPAVVGSLVTLVGRLDPPAQGTQVTAQIALVDMASGQTTPGALQADGSFSFARLRPGALYYIVGWQHVRVSAGGTTASHNSGSGMSDQRLSWHQVIQAGEPGTFSLQLSHANCDGEYTTDVLPASAIRSPGSGRRADLTPISGG